MATVLEKTIEIIFQGDDRSSAAIGSVIGGMNKLEGAVTAVSGPLREIADGVIKADLALNSLAFAGLAYAYAKSVEFEGAMIELEKVVGSDQVEALNKAKNAAIDFSEKYGVSATEIVASMANFAQAGFTVEEAMQLVGNSLDLVIAGGIDAAQSSEILVAALKGFREPASEAGRLIDILNEVSNNYATSAEQLGVGMAGLSPIAQAMGLSMEETAGVLTPVIEVFRSGDEAAIALKTGLLKLVDDSKPVRDALASIGVSQTDANGALRSGKDILYDVMEAFTGLSEEQKLFVTQQLVGIDQSARMVTVFDNLEYVLRVTEAAMGAAGSAAQEVAVRLASAEVQIEIFKKSFENLAVAIGDKFKVATTDAVGGLSDITQALRGLVASGAFDDIFDLINEFATNLGEFFRDVANALPEAMKKVDFDPLVASFRKLVDTATELFKAVFPDDLTTVDGLATAIKKIVDAWATLNDIAAKILTAWKPFFEAIGLVIEGLGDADSEISKFVGKLADMLGPGQVVDRMIDRFGLLGGTILGAMVNGLSLASREGGIFSGSMGEGAAAVAELEGGISGKLLRTLESFGISVADASIETEGLGNVVSGFPEGIQIDFSAPGMLELQGALASFGLSLNDIPREKIVELAAITDPVELHNAIAALGAIPDLKQVGVETDVDQPSLEKSKNDLDNNIPEKKDTDVYSRTDKGSLDTVQGQLDVLAAKRVMEVEARADEYALEQMKAQFDLMQTAVEWKAKLDIAEVEANAKKVEAAFSTLESVFTSSAEIVSSALGALGGDFGAFGDSTRNKIFNVIEKELELRDRAMTATEDLIKTQIEYMESKMKAMESGQALIQIDGAGLQPHLEAFMWEVLGAIQTRVNEEGHAMLFGL